MVLPHDRRLYAAQLGDSRAVLGRKIGRTGPCAAQPQTGNISGDDADKLLTRDAIKPPVRSAAGASSRVVGAWLAARITQDHKPELPAERMRVESAGGEVVFVGGCWRASHPECISYLACSRAIGDLSLKQPSPVVSSEPELITRALVAPEFDDPNARTADHFVVTASDGVWDVISDQEAVDLVGQTISEPTIDSGFPKPEGRNCGDPSAHVLVYEPPGDRGRPASLTLKRAAEKLVQLALDRRSLDNITAVVQHFDWEYAKA